MGILREYYGRGPTKAKTYALDDLIVCVLRNGYTAVEKTIVESGDPDRVVQMRHEFQQLLGPRYKEMIEELTGRKVIAFLSQAHLEPDITIEVFLIDRPLDHAGSAEIAHPKESGGRNEPD